MKKKYIIPTISVMQLENLLTLEPGSVGVTEPTATDPEEIGGDAKP